MRFVLLNVAAFFVFILPRISLAGVENLISLQRAENGNFYVLCDNEGTIKSREGVTPDEIRANAVCANHTQSNLEEGLYITSTEFCGQTIKWSGEKILIILSAPCSGQLEMSNVKSGWFRGGLEGYPYVYELEVKSNTDYVFYSRSYGNQGDFKKSNSEVSPMGPASKRSADPAGR